MDSSFVLSVKIVGLLNFTIAYLSSGRRGSGRGHGRPAIQLHGELAARVGDLRVLVSLSHEGSMAAAVVVIEEGGRLRRRAEDIAGFRFA